MRTELVVALDYPNAELADQCIQNLKGLPVIYKVGLELFMGTSPTWVKKLCANQRVFLDLKFFDIPNTVGQAVIRGASLGAEFMTLHLSGGKLMFDEVSIKIREAMAAGQLQTAPKILGVSVLTSFQEEDWIANVSHMAKLSAIRSIEDTVMHFANMADEHAAIQGLVCSPKEIAVIRAKFPNLFLMVPGIRPMGGDLHDQKRVMTPVEAGHAGASAIVVGRPITQSKTPRLVAESILRELE
jgi:orotidine-5'-phosphate decarboxylase